MLTMKNIVKEENPILRQIAKEVPIPLSSEEIKLGKVLLQFLKNSKNPILRKKLNLESLAGIAAPQIGISKRIIAIYTKDENKIQHSYILFNPEIISYSKERTHLPTGEKCLSVSSKVAGYVPRHAAITVKGISLKGKEVELHLEGFLAVVFQHEIDHLNGILFVDRINEKNPLSVPNSKK